MCRHLSLLSACSEDSFTPKKLEPLELDASKPEPDASKPEPSKPDASKSEPSEPDASKPESDASTSDAGRCSTLKERGCDFGLGCGDYDAKRAELTQACERDTRYGGYLASEGCGYRILAQVYGAGDTVTGFYDPQTGELAGLHSITDTLERECAGAVPAECLVYGGTIGTGLEYVGDAGAAEELCRRDGGASDAAVKDPGLDATTGVDAAADGG